jgi:hypothetical protein
LPRISPATSISTRCSGSRDEILPNLRTLYVARRVADFLKRETRKDVEAAVARHAKRLGVAPRRSALALLYRC